MATQGSDQRPYTKEELEETVDIEIVGANERRTFKILRIHLDTYTPSLAGLFKFKGVKAVQLGNVSIQTFEHFLSWISEEFQNTCLTHHGEGRWKNLSILPDWFLHESSGASWNVHNKPPLWDGFEWSLWDYANIAVDMYFFAEAYEIPKLCQDAVNRIIWCHRAAHDGAYLAGYIATSCIEAVYERTEPHNVIGRLLIDGYCESGPKRYRKAMMNLPKEFMVDVIRCMAGKAVQKQYLAEPCAYHRHTSAAERKGCEVRDWMKREE